MALSPTYFARGDSNNASNAELNVRSLAQYPVTSIQFTSGTTGDLLLDWVADGPDANTLPEFDPDTQIIIGGLTRNFVFLKSGTLDPARVPLALANDPVYVIKIDMNNDGDVNDAGDVQIFFSPSLDGTAANMTAIQNGALRIGGLDLDPPPGPVCLCAGTLVLTSSGNRLVELLRTGDLVLNDRGEAKQIAWIGHSKLSRADLIRNAQLRPVRIAAGVFGVGCPAQDLDVSPQHRIVIEGALPDLLFAQERVLVPAKYLIGTLAEQVEPVADVQYYHILLEDHELLVTNGLVTESFQPARRMIEVMSPDMQSMVMAVIDALGAEHMLTRKDALRSLNQSEGELLAHLLARSLRAVSGAHSHPGTSAVLA
jgi:hypothetical protein